MRAVLLVLAAAVCFGTTGTAQTFAPDGATPAAVGAARIVVGGGVLALVGAVVWLARRSRTGSTVAPGATLASAPGAAAPDGGLPRPRRVLAVVVGALAMVGYQPAFFAGTQANGVAVGTLVALGSGPLFAGLLEWLVLRRRPSRRWVGATALAVVGVGLLAATPGAGTGASGLLSSLAAGACYAVYTVATKVLLGQGWGVVRVVATVFGLGAVLALPLLLTGPTAWLTQGSGLAVALWLGVVTVALAYLLFAAGLRDLPAATAATLTLAEPVTAGLLGVLVLGEVLGPQSWIGVAIVVGAVVLLTLPARQRRREAPAPAA